MTLIECMMGCSGPLTGLGFDRIRCVIHRNRYEGYFLVPEKAPVAPLADAFRNAGCSVQVMDSELHVTHPCTNPIDALLCLYLVVGVRIFDKYAHLDPLSFVVFSMHPTWRWAEPKTLRSFTDLCDSHFVGGGGVIRDRVNYSITRQEDGLYVCSRDGVVRIEGTPMRILASEQWRRDLTTHLRCHDPKKKHLSQMLYRAVLSRHLCYS